MFSFIVSGVLAGSISALAAVLVLAQRQFETGETAIGHASSPRPEDPLPRPPSAQPSAGLVPAIAGAIEATSRLEPANLHDVEAVTFLQAAMSRAVDGEFSAEVGRVIDSLTAVESVPALGAGSTGGDVADASDVSIGVDHLVVTPSGVVVVTSKVRAKALDQGGAPRLVGRALHHSSDDVVDDIVACMEAIADAMDPVPVRGVVVVRDLAALPDHYRSSLAEARGVRLVPISRLAELLVEPGPIGDCALVRDRLEVAFEHGFRMRLRPPRLVAVGGDRSMPTHCS